MANYFRLVALWFLACFMVFVTAGETDILFCNNARAPEDWEWTVYPCLQLTNIQQNTCYNWPDGWGKQGGSYRVQKGSYHCYVFEEPNCKKKKNDRATGEMVNLEGQYASFSCICERVGGCG